MVNQKSFIIVFGILLALALSSCFQSKPTQYDSTFSAVFYVRYQDKALAEVPVKLSTDDFRLSAFTDTTDAEGRVAFESLPWAVYHLNIKTTAYIPSPVDSTKNDTVTVIATEFFEPNEVGSLLDTVEVIVSGTEPGLKINEIYAAGPPNNFFYFYDQFIELYNSGDETVYLDGMVVCRMGYLLESITYIFQFPGEPLGGQEYPVEPGQFVVIAQDAYDHRDIVSESIDLTYADWEFRNSADFGDWDNPDVPNIDNIEVGHHLDFMIALTSDVILIADGSDLNYLDGMNLEAVIDCVEYSSNSSHRKDIESSVDRGFAGVGMPKYSAMSIERVAPGFDTNNSTVDFTICNRPSPGYQHE